MTVGTVHVGGIALEAPLGPPTHTVGTFGEMWQWIGDGKRLFSLIVAVREGKHESVDGLRNRLLAETDRVASSLRPLASGGLRPVEVDVRGVFAAFKTSVDGTRDGIKVHNALLIATDRVNIYFAHVTAPYSETNRRLASSLLSGVRLLE